MRKYLFWTAIFGFLATLVAAPTPQSTRVKLADGFDFPVGKPDAENYYIYRGFRANGHLGEDWNGTGGGNTDLGDPTYSIAHGIVVFAKDVKKGWGNCVIVRHAYLENGSIRAVDSLYAHLDRITVREGQRVERGDLVGTIGTNRGMYTAHLHFEMRKNLYVGMNRTKFPRDFSVYYDPSDFINARRKLPGGNRSGLVAINTFNHEQNFDSPSDGGSKSLRVVNRDEIKSDTSRKTPQKPFTVERFRDLF